MKKVLGTIFFILYSIMAVFVTVLLLSYNNYNCSQLGAFTFYIVRDDTMEPNYHLGDLLIIKSASDKNISEGDMLYFYDVINKEDYIINYQKLMLKTKSSRHITYTLEDGSSYDSSYLIGKEEGSMTIHGLGAVLAVLESRWGYLFFVVIVSLLLFLQELFELIMEIRHGAPEDDIKKKKRPTQRKTTSKTVAKTSHTTKSANTVKTAKDMSTTKIEKETENIEKLEQ